MNRVITLGAIALATFMFGGQLNAENAQEEGVMEGNHIELNCAEMTLENAEQQVLDFCDAAQAEADQTDGLLSRIFGWNNYGYHYGAHSGYHSGGHSGYHSGSHSGTHYSPYNGYHYGSHYGSHSGGHYGSHYGGHYGGHGYGYGYHGGQYYGHGGYGYGGYSSCVGYYC